MKKVVGYGLIAVLSLAVFNSYAIEPSNPLLADGIYSFAGLGMMVFGIWGAVLLLKK